MNKEVKEFIWELKARGWNIKRQDGKHIILHYVHGGQLTVAKTPSDHRAFLNIQAEAKRIEKAYGPYIPPVKKAIHTNGFDFQAPKIYSITRPNAGDATKAIRAVLTEQKDKLYRTIEPYMALVEEYHLLCTWLEELAPTPQVKEPKQIFTGDEIVYVKPEQPVDTVHPMIKPLELIPAKDEVVKSHKKYRLNTKKMYIAATAIVRNHDGRMPLRDLLQWLTDVEKYQLGGKHQGPYSHLVQSIQLIHKTNPHLQKMVLIPVDPLATGTRIKYKDIMIKEKESWQNTIANAQSISSL